MSTVVTPPSPPTSYSDIHNVSSPPSKDTWYNNIPEKFEKSSEKVTIAFYSVSYVYGCNTIGVSYFIADAVRARDTDNLTVQWCAAMDQTKIDGSSIYTKTLDAQKVTVWRNIDGVDKLLFRADGTSNDQAEHKVEIGNYYVDPLTGGLVGEYSSDSTQAIIARYKNESGVVTRYSTLLPSGLTIWEKNMFTSINGPSHYQVNFTYLGIQFVGGQHALINSPGGITLGGPLTIAGKLFPGASIVYDSKPPYTSDDVGRVIFVKEQNS